MFMPMTISGLTIDPLTNSPIVILKEVDGERTLPIWIGLLEATAIASELEGIKFFKTDDPRSSEGSLGND